MAKPKKTSKKSPAKTKSKAAKAAKAKAKPAKKSATPAKKKPKPAKTRPAKTAVVIPSDPVTDRWWDIIERSGKGAEDADQQGDALINLLQTELTADEIVAFDQFINERLRDAYRGDLWGVAHIMNGGCSDDGFDYFCGWLVCKGRKHYYAALANPEDAAKGVTPDDEPFENEAPWYAPARAWVNKTGKTENDFEQVRAQVTRNLDGELFEEETLYDQHPALAKKFGG